MKKQITILICAGLILSLSLCLTAYGLTNDRANEVIKTQQKDNVVYSVSVSSVAGLARQGGANISVSMEITSEDNIEIATCPIVATDAEMNKTLEVTEVSMDNSNLNFEISTQTTMDTLYIQTPYVTRISECAVIEDTVGLSAENCFIQELGSNLSIVHFDSDTFDTIPNKAELEIDGYTYQSLYVDHYFNDQGECIGGDIAFVTPDAFSLTDCGLKITQSLEVVGQEIFSINVKELVT